jgi:hypothetical protein
MAALQGCRRKRPPEKSGHLIVHRTRKKTPVVFVLKDEGAAAHMPAHNSGYNPSGYIPLDDSVDSSSAGDLETVNLRGSRLIRIPAQVFSGPFFPALAIQQAASIALTAALAELPEGAQFDIVPVSSKRRRLHQAQIRPAIGTPRLAK